MDNKFYVTGPRYNPEAQEGYKYEYTATFREVLLTFGFSEEEIQRRITPQSFVDFFAMRMTNSYAMCFQFAGEILEDGCLCSDSTEIHYEILPDTNNMPHYKLLTGVMALFIYYAKSIEACLYRLDTFQE